jgi:hypothetical protein
MESPAHSSGVGVPPGSKKKRTVGSGVFFLLIFFLETLMELFSLVVGYAPSKKFSSATPFSILQNTFQTEAFTNEQQQHTGKLSTHGH